MYHIAKIEKAIIKSWVLAEIGRLLGGPKSDSFACGGWAWVGVSVCICTHTHMYWQNLVIDYAGFSDQRGKDRFLDVGTTENNL